MLFSRFLSHIGPTIGISLSACLSPFGEKDGRTSCKFAPGAAGLSGAGLMIDARNAQPWVILLLLALSSFALAAILPWNEGCLALRLDKAPRSSYALVVVLWVHDRPNHSALGTDAARATIGYFSPDETPNPLID
jgi:hypothetical protein